MLRFMKAWSPRWAEGQAGAVRDSGRRPAHTVMTTVVVGLLAAVTGGIAFRFAWRYWSSIRRGFMYWVWSAVTSGIALFSFVILMVGLWPLGIFAAFGTAAWLASAFIYLDWSRNVQRRYWSRLGERTIDKLEQRHGGEVPPSMSGLVALFRRLAGDTKKRRPK